MIVSNDGKSYDRADGSEQPHAAFVEPRERSEREEINRWEDDGPGPTPGSPRPRLRADDRRVAKARLERVVAAESS